MTTVQYRPEVAEDIREAASWYDRKREGLGEDFQREFWSAIESVMAHPFSFGITTANTRACRLSRFPYVIHFQYNEEDEVNIVYAVIYGGRESSAWIDRV